MGCQEEELPRPTVLFWSPLSSPTIFFAKEESEQSSLEPQPNVAQFFFQSLCLFSLFFVAIHDINSQYIMGNALYCNTGAGNEPIPLPASPVNVTYNNAPDTKQTVGNFLIGGPGCEFKNITVKTSNPGCDTNLALHKVVGVWGDGNYSEELLCEDLFGKSQSESITFTFPDENLYVLRTQGIVDYCQYPENCNDCPFTFDYFYSSKSGKYLGNSCKKRSSSKSGKLPTSTKATKTEASEINTMEELFAEDGMSMSVSFIPDETDFSFAYDV